MATKRKSKPKPITFFGRELEPDQEDLGGEYAGNRELAGVHVSEDWRTPCTPGAAAFVDLLGQRDQIELYRKSKRAAVAAAERETLKLLGKLAAATGHELVKKGRGK